MKCIILLLSLFFSSILYSRMPRNDYIFNAPNISELYPFSKKERIQFKQKKIKEVIVEGTTKETMRTIHKLDSNANVIKSTITSVKKGKTEQWAVINYKYNNYGQLLVKKINGKYETVIDSIEYDSLGCIVYYSNNSISKGHRLSLKSHFFDYKFEKYQNNFTVLSSDSGSIRYLFNKKNECIMIKTDSSKYRSQRIDSINIDSTSSEYYTKTYFLKFKKDSSYRIARLETYKDGLIQTYENFDTFLNLSSTKKEYIYGNNQELLRVEPKNKNYTQVFFTYYRNHFLFNDLKSQKIKVFPDGTTFITNYTYKTY